jgi:drug/metabolite transporter (DMT)-like permease
MHRSVLLGIAASFFFAFTFVLNRQMNLAGGSWIWTAVLRYLFMLPLLFALVMAKGRYRPVLSELGRRPGAWLLWSTVGFGLFYAPLSFAAQFGPSWLVAATWQVTIVAGALLTPLFFAERSGPDGPVKVCRRLPRGALALSCLILVGICLLQWQEAGRIGAAQVLAGLVPVLAAAFAYPLGNRKMMELTGARLNTIQRVFGMTLASLPFWLVLGAVGLCLGQWPSQSVILQSALVALCSGVIATLLFFQATNLVRHDPHRLAVVESTQSGEVLFSLLGGVLLFGDKLPSPFGFVGLGLVVLGMTLQSLSLKSA